jgi:NAD(P)-dependent dehydrogenase (short-subunit alcohol dehydrogenase family)
MMKRKLEGAVVVITGASSGIGRATALEFARHGARPVLAARNEAALRQLVAECEELGVAPVAVPTDMGDDRAVDELASRAMENLGRIDVWVNNAAVMLFGRFEDIPADSFRRVIETNFFGYVNGARAALRCFALQGFGVLINNASGNVYGGAPFASPYVASKFAVRGLGASLRQELALTGKPISVVTILPGAVDTPLLRHAANFSGFVPHPPAPVHPPEQVARAIVRSARRPRREVFVGGTAFAAFVRALLPPFLRRLPFSQAPALPSEGNLRHPLPPEAISGGWDRSRWPAMARLSVAALLIAAPTWLWLHHRRA